MDAGISCSRTLSVANFAEVTNKGSEVGMGFDILTQDNFKWTSSINWSRNKNEVVKIDGPSDITTTETGFSGVSSVAQVGNRSVYSKVLPG